jgi:hypothetical protein
VAVLLVAVVVAGVGARLWLWWNVKGTSDVERWMRFGEAVHENGLHHTYVTDTAFNHPPRMGLYAAAVWEVTGDTVNDFARGLKLAALLGEAIVLAVLTRLAGLPALAAYAAAPAAILVAGWHGNTDPLVAAFVLLAALAFDRARFFTAGLAFGAALNVKLLPLLLLPLLLIGAPDRRALGRICGALALAAIPFIPVLLTTAPEMYRNMIAYNSSPNDWGFLAFLNRAKDQPELQGAFEPVRDAFLTYGRYLVLSAVVALGVASRLRLHFSMIEQFALGGALFLFLTSGFGVQYVVLIAGLLILVNLAYGVAWGIAAGAFIGIFYSANHITDHAIRNDQNRNLHFLWTEVGILAWVLLGLFIWRQIADRRAATAGRPAKPPDSG